MSKKLKAIFFDAGGTLFCPHPSVGEIYASAAAEYGATCDPAVLEQEFQSAWVRRKGLSSLGTETNEDKERAWWRDLVEDVFKSSGGVPRFEAFFNGLHQSFTHADLWRIYPEVIEVLIELRDKGLVLGIVSNWDLRLPIIIRNLGLRSRFDFVLGSSAFGATKPSVRIFEEALKRAGAKPSEAAHVGDTYHEDYLGAEQTGITAFHLDRDGVHDSVPDKNKVKCLREFRDRVLS